MQFEISLCAALVRRDDDAAPQLEQQPLGGGTGQGVGGGVGGRHGAGPAQFDQGSLGSPPAMMVSMLPGAQASLFSSMA